MCEWSTVVGLQDACTTDRHYDSIIPWWDDGRASWLGPCQKQQRHHGTSAIMAPAAGSALWYRFLELQVAKVELAD